METENRHYQNHSSKKLNDLGSVKSPEHYDQRILSTAKNLFYNCRYNLVIKEIDHLIKEVEGISVLFKLYMIKAKAYFELNKRDMALGILENLSFDEKFNNHCDYYYTKGSFYYFKNDYEKAIEYFKSMLDYNHDKEGIYKSLLALGNIAYSQGRKDDCLQYIKELDQIEIDHRELKISLLHLKGNYLAHLTPELIKAQEYFQISYQESLKCDWNYFAQRSLYNLAKVFKMRKLTSEALGMLHVLDLNLSLTDSRYLSILVNNEFEKLQHRSTQKLTLNEVEKKVIVGQEDQYELNLSRFPILFNFINFLFVNKGFVSKEKIALHLWPTQKYKPRTHDPRIYDVVKRLKQKMEVLEENPLVLETCSGGYKLNIT